MADTGSWIERDVASVWHGFTQMACYADNRPAIVDRALHKHRQLRELKATQTVTMVSSGDFATARRAPARSAPGRARRPARP